MLNLQISKFQFELDYFSILFEIYKVFEIYTMLNSSQTLHHRLTITDHFDDVLNEIDIKTETLLQDQSLAEEKQRELNELREKQIEKIKEIEEIFLNLLQNDEEEELEDLEKLIHYLIVFYWNNLKV